MIPALASAQAVPDMLKNDVGPMAELQLTEHFISNNIAGIQFRHQRSDIVAWRASAGYFSLRNSGGATHLYPFADTLTTRSVDELIKGLAVSGGIEAQRRFFKKIYLYAGADLRIGYGTAVRDTQLNYEYYAPSTTFPGTGLERFTASAERQSSKGNGLIVTAAILVGARVYAGHRFIIGTEFTNPAYYINFKAGNQSGNTNGIDLSIGQVVQRIYVSYRF